MNREQELRGIALWVEKHHGEAAADYIGEQVKRLAAVGDGGGVALWFAVADRRGRSDKPASTLADALLA